ncbi:MAG: hypothetical protein NZ914_03795 [Gemmatales bacterium]|nr:hypothetical protein [Gemmatales bacterium]
MSGRLSAFLAVVLLSGLAITWADSIRYALRERARIGQQWRAELQTRVQVEPKSSKSKIVVTAEHRVWESILALAEVHPSQADKPVLHGIRPGLPIRVARYYERADWHRQVQGVMSASAPGSPLEKRQLRPERRLVVAWRGPDQTVVFSPNGPLTREELDLTQGHLDLLMVPNLLPEQLVAVGDTWTVPIPVVQAMCGLDGVTESQVQGKLTAVRDGHAFVSIEGQVAGIVDGSETNNHIRATCEFDLNFERWLRLHWQQTQQRQAGPVTSALTLQADIRAERHFDGQCEHLTPAVLQNLPAEPTAPFLLLSYRAPKNVCEFLYDRAWHRISQDERFAVFRLLDRGELVAQMNVTFWPEAQPGQHLSTEQIRQFARQTPQFQLEKEIESGELPAQDGRWIYRHTVQGKSEGLPVVLTWYVVAHKDGRQVVFVFTVEPSLADKLGGRDLAIVQSVSFPPR